jgi:hypothetical protein
MISDNTLIPEIPDITTALPGILPTLRGETLKGWGMMAGLLIAAVILAFVVKDLGKDGKGWAFVILFTAVVSLGAVATYIRRRHEALIMPLLTKAAGLSYDQKGRWFLDTLPPRLLPKASDRTCEDVLSGKIGDRAIRFAEVKIETGGKNSNTLFRGIVMEFPNLVDMPAFFIASERETRGFFVFKGNIRVDDLVQVRSLTGRSGAEYGVWSSSAAAAEKPGFGAVVNVLTGLESIIGGDAKLYTASSDGREMHVAISHKRDLFKIGGMFADSTRLMQDIRHAYDDMTLPMRIVSALLSAEAEVARAAGVTVAAV